ncbi:MAG: iron-containing alcohol dehydrogenase [Anaerolineae bacterium]
MAEISYHLTAPRLVFGVGAVAEIPDEVVRLVKGKVLVVTDPGLVEVGVAAQVTTMLNEAGVGHVVFSGVEPNPSVDTVQAALQLYGEENCQCLLAVGGGSSMDTAKAVGILASNGGDIRDYEGIGKVKRPLPPLLAIPTTVGTGSEVTVFTVITDRDRCFKMTIGSPFLLPQTAILDPALTTSLPPAVIASTGMDALTHAVESYTSLGSTPFSEPFALQAIRLIARSLPQAVAGREVTVMGDMLYASAMAGMAFTNTRLGNAHAMSHPLGGYYNLAHGVANAVLLPHVMEFNLPACPAKMARIAEAMGEEVGGLSEAEAAHKALEAVRRLSAEIGIPSGLGALGVTEEEHMAEMTNDAMLSGNILVNPRKTTREDVLKLYQKAL